MNSRDPSTHQSNPPGPPSPESIDVASTALFLDIDGTLIDLAPTPGSVVIPPKLVALLRTALVIFDGAVAINTGRCISDADELLSPLKLVTAGVHGCELRSQYQGTIVPESGDIDPYLLSALNLIADLIPGVLIEPKGPGIAVHYRLVPLRRNDVEARVRALIADHSRTLIVSCGRMVLEILPRHRSKGTAIEALLALTPFSGRKPLVIGDDVGDEPAFAVAARYGGIALKVAGERFSQESADFDGPVAVRNWFAHLVEVQPARQ